MEAQIATFKEIAAQQRDLPVWEKFENHEEEHPKLAMQPPPKMDGCSTIWFTQNMEYGRFQLKNRGFPVPGEENENVHDSNQQPDGSRPQSEGGQSYLSDKLDTEREVPDGNNATEGNNNTNEQERVPSGVQTYPPVDMKYYAASRRSNRPDDPSGNRLTTGYAKQWMSNEHGRFWNNIQEVAPVAGFDTSPKPISAQASNAEILKVE